MDILDKLRELGVKELSVTNGLATAVNLYDPEIWEEERAYNVLQKQLFNLSPLPTSGIPDGSVGIDEVEPCYQMFYKRNGENNWFIIEMPESDFNEYSERFPDIYRLAIRKKQPEEVKPEGEMQTDNIPNWMRDHASRLAKEIRGEDSSLLQPEQPEQTVEFKWTDDSVIDFVNAYVDLHNLGIKYKLENRNIVESFKKGEINEWKS